jgi:hypothetical protein
MTRRPPAGNGRGRFAAIVLSKGGHMWQLGLAALIVIGAYILYVYFD